MDPEAKPRLAVAIGALGEAFRQRISPATIRAYEIGLGDLPIESIEAAVARAIRSCRFMPVPLELRELSGACNLPDEDRAVLAWDALCRAIDQYGPYRSIDFDDQAINATVRALGGWTEIDEKIGDKWFRKEFERLYASYCRTGLLGSAGLPLPGIHELTNREHNHPDAIARPVEITTGLPVLPQARLARTPNPAGREITALLESALKPAEVAP